jgi:hypothetical protein
MIIRYSELRNGIRINVVSSGIVEDAVEKYAAYFPGHNPIPMKKVINGYVKSVDSLQSPCERYVTFDNKPYFVGSGVKVICS